MIFISYSRKDKFYLRRILRELDTRGFDVWVDERIEPGTPNWRAAIEQAIENCNLVLVLLSPNAKQSEWVSYEIAYAEAQGKNILPILVHGNSANAVPIRLIVSQWIDLRAEEYFSTGIEKVIETILDFTANFDDAFSSLLHELHEITQQSNKLSQNDIVQILNLHWKQVDDASVRLLVKISGQFKAEQNISRDWLSLLDTRRNLDGEIIFPLSEDIRSKFISLNTTVHKFAFGLVPPKSKTALWKKIEENLISWLDVPGDERKQIVLTAGDLLIHLGWTPLIMRQPVIDALRAVMMDMTNAIYLRREAGFRLLRLRWLNESELVPAEEVLDYFDLVDWFVGSPNDLEYHINCLCHLLENNDNNSLLRARLLVARAVSAAKLWLKNGKAALAQQATDDYEEAEKIVTKLIAAGKDEGSGERLLARIHMGLGNICRELVKGLENEKKEEKEKKALQFHKKAVNEAKANQQDVLLLANVYNELGATYIERNEWEESDYCYITAINHIKTLKSSDHQLFISFYPRICEVASMSFWDQGYWCKDGQEPDSPEYYEAFSMFARAYKYADFALSQLKPHEPFNAEDLAYAEYNAFASLTEFFKADQYEHPEAPQVNPVTDFFAHLMEAVQIARNLPDQQVWESILDFYVEEFDEIGVKVLAACEDEQNITEDMRKLIGLILSFLQEIKDEVRSEQIENHLQTFTQLAQTWSLRSN